jgi:hypothetical protein
MKPPVLQLVAGVPRALGEPSLSVDRQSSAQLFPRKSRPGKCRPDHRHVEIF